MSSRVRVFPVLVMLFVIVACGIISVRQMDGDIRVIEEDIRDVEIALREKQNALSKDIIEVNNQDTRAYIINNARALGYLMPGEIHFVVTFPEDLDDMREETAAEAVVETDQEVPAE